MAAKTYIKAMKKYAKGYKIQDILSSNSNGANFICQNHGSTYIVTIIAIKKKAEPPVVMDSAQISNLFDENYDFPIRNKYHLLHETNIDNVAFVERYDSRSTDYCIRKIEENKLIELSKNQSQIIRADPDDNYRQDWNAESTPASPPTSPVPRFHVPMWLASLIMLMIVGTIALLCIRPWMIKVPSVISKNVMEAEYLLSETDLNMVITSARYYDSEKDGDTVIPIDSIISQAPTVGNSLNKNSDVWVEVSKGKKQVYMPDVTGMLVESTEQVLENADADDLSVEVKYEYSDRDMVGTVIKQSIGMDKASDFDGKLTLTVSLGPEMLPTQEHSVVLEDYTGMQFEDVKSELIKSGIYLVKSAAVYSSEYQYGEIITQSPAKEEIVKSGDAVYVVTSLGTEKARVPDVQYLEVEEAKEILLSAGLLYEIHYVINPNVKPDYVATQSIIPGRLTTFKTKIVLEVSEASEYTEVSETAEIQFETENMSLSVGDSVKLNISYSGNEKVRFSSSNSHILSVDYDGNITAHRFGTATVIAYTNEGIAVCTVFVNDESRITSIKDVRLKIGEVVSLASSIPESIRNTVVWRSTNPNIVSVDSNGEITANSIGFSQVFASYKNQTISCDVVIESEYIELSKEAMKQLSSAESLLKAKKVSYNIERAYSQTLPKDRVISVVYSGYSDNEYYYVSNGTNVTLKISLGKETVTDKIIAVESIRVSPETLSLVRGESKKLSFYITPGNAADQSITLKSSDTSVIQVSGFTVTAAKVGTATITAASANGKTAVCQITVAAPAVSSVSVSEKYLYLTVGDTRTLSATVSPYDSNDKTVMWKSSNNNVVTVDSYGNLKALASGTAKITASTGAKSDVCNVTVNLPEVSGVTISETNLYLESGQKQTLTASVSPSNAGNKTITWSSDNKNVAIVDANGQVTALASGTAKITASAGAKSDVCNITVNLPEVSGVTISETNLYLESGQKQTLTASVSPSNAGNKTITWSYDNKNVAIVDANGQVTALASGTAKITAQAGGKQAFCTVTVTTPVQSISIESESTIELGRTYTVTPTISPENADDRSFTMKTSDTGVLSVDGNKFKGLKAGTATLTVTTSNGKSASCKVTVLGEAELTLVQKPTKTTYYVGDDIDTSGLMLGYTDTTGKYSEITKGFTLSGYDMYSSGTQTVSVKYDGLTVKLDITVKKPGIAINKLPFDNTVLFAVQTEPEDQEFEIWSSDHKVFTVSSYLGSSYIAQPAGEGTAYAYASMVYKGVEYSDYVAVTVEHIAEAYTFEISYTPGSDGISIYTIQTDIPDFDVNEVKWSCTADCDAIVEKGMYVVYDRDDFDFYTVTAYYYHNGTPFETTYTYHYTVNDDNNNSDNEHIWGDIEIIQPGDICADLYEP